MADQKRRLEKSRKGFGIENSYLYLSTRYDVMMGKTEFLPSWDWVSNKVFEFGLEEVFTFYNREIKASVTSHLVLQLANGKGKSI